VSRSPCKAAQPDTPAIVSRIESKVDVSGEVTIGVLVNDEGASEFYDSDRPRIQRLPQVSFWQNYDSHQSDFTHHKPPVRFNQLDLSNQILTKKQPALPYKSFNQ
jgi:hypothetical protein